MSGLAEMRQRTDFGNTPKRLQYRMQLVCSNKVWARIGLHQTLRQIRLIQKKDCVKEL